VRVRYTLPALAELDAILDYLATRSPQGAARVQRRIRTYVDLLPSYPLIGAKTDDPTIRRLTARPYPYVVLYEAGEGEIIIHSVRHAARRPEGES
jgi:plasmid stabilization system protein ParE